MMGVDRDAMMRTSFWLERTLLIGLLYFAVEGDKKHFLPLLAGLILHDFILFVAKDVVYPSFKAQSSLDLKGWKLRSSNPRVINLINGGKKVINDLKEEGDPELGTKSYHEDVGDEGIKYMHNQQVPCERCKTLLEEEAVKAKEKYKERYKKKLMEKEEKLKKDKRSLKDKYNEDRAKWEEERNLLKKKYEEMRWT